MFKKEKIILNEDIYNYVKKYWKIYIFFRSTLWMPAEKYIINNFSKYFDKIIDWIIDWYKKKYNVFSIKKYVYNNWNIYIEWEIFIQTDNMKKIILMISKNWKAIFSWNFSNNNFINKNKLKNTIKEYIKKYYK